MLCPSETSSRQLSSRCFTIPWNRDWFETGVSGQTWWCLGCTVAWGSSFLSSSGCADGITVITSYMLPLPSAIRRAVAPTMLSCPGARDPNLTSGDLKISKSCRSFSAMWPFLIRQWISMDHVEIMLKQLGSALFHKGCGCEQLAWLVQVGIPSLLCEPQPEGSPHEPVRPVTKKGEHVCNHLGSQTLTPYIPLPYEPQMWMFCLGNLKSSQRCLQWAGRGLRAPPGPSSMSTCPSTCQRSRRTTSTTAWNERLSWTFGAFQHRIAPFVCICDIFQSGFVPHRWPCNYLVIGPLYGPFNQCPANSVKPRWQRRCDWSLRLWNATS